jgi:hypothetical protein
MTGSAFRRHSHSRRGRVPRSWGLLLASLIIPATDLAAQHDYYNTDVGRPLATEDAVAMEEGAFELKAAPVTIRRLATGVYGWHLEPELMYGLPARTQAALGVPLLLHDGPQGSTSAGLGGVHLSVLHQLNVESTTLPAFAAGVAALLPAGSMAPDDTHLSIRANSTRTFSWGRLHANVVHALGSRELAAGASAHGMADDLVRWKVGVSADRAFALSAMLAGAEVVAEQPLVEGSPVIWVAGVGVRRQLGVRWVLDAGISRRLTEGHEAWSFTLGSSYAFGIPRFRY